MAAGPESLIVRAILKALGKRGAWCFKVHGGPHQAAGIPDIVGVIGGKFFAIEVKVPGGSATPLQALTLSRIAAAGGMAGVATSVTEALGIIGKA